jgi:8-oxo-dGTP diphosphatase
MQPEDQRRPDPRYTVIPRTLIFLTRGACLLLLKGAPDKRLWAGKYNGLGGHIEADETPWQSARRETREETGLDVRNLQLRGVVHITMPDPPGVMLFVFVGEALTGQFHASDEGTPTWVSVEEVHALPLVEDLHELIPRVLEPGPVISAHYTFTDEGLQMAFEPQHRSELEAV